MTRTYAVLDVSKSAFDEIFEKLEKHGYKHAFHTDRTNPDPDRMVIDMHGIALRAVAAPELPVILVPPPRPNPVCKDGEDGELCFYDDDAETGNGESDFCTRCHGAR